MRTSAAWLLGLVLGLAACSKPSEEDCRKAVFNLQRLRGFDSRPQAPDPNVAIRACRATGNSGNVKCLIAAKTAAEADACDALK